MYKICKYCGAEFKTYKSAQQYCSRLCWALCQRTHKEKICKYCWNVFYSNNDKAKYCSKECTCLGEKKTKEIICPICEKSFHQKYKEQQYCSRQCAKKAMTLPNRICIICWKSFHPHDNSTIYCSLHCSVMWQRAKLSQEQREEKLKKMNNMMAISWINREYAKIFRAMWYDVEFEFWVNGRPYDLRIWNILVEINPYPFHNSTRVPRLEWAKPKWDTYHYDKYKNAVEAWYRCVMVRDWTTEEELAEMMNNENFHYEWLPRLHYYNPETNEHIIATSLNKSLEEKWFVAIYDCGNEVK